MKIAPTCNQPFLDCLQSIYHSKFTGKFTVKSHAGLSWNLYFGLGNLIWIGGGRHPNRFIYREIRKASPQLNLRDISIPKGYQPNCSHYHILDFLFNTEKINENCLRAIFINKFIEDFFDIFQQESLGPVEYAQESKSREAMYEEGLRLSFITMQTIEICDEARELWSAWEKQGYSYWSPNMAPLLVQPEELKKVVLANTFQNLIRLLDGTRSLRDLSSLMNQSLQKIATSLSGHVRQGYVNLVEIQDLKLNLSDPARNLFGEQKVKPSSIPPSSQKKQLVTCIDDSSQVRKVMGLILTRAGYNYMCIDHPLNAVPVLIKTPPDLIFLDLTMPLINGYELCAQIRRVSKLQDIPIVILTSNTGIVDRIRTRVLGVSKFVTKPFDKDEIIAIVEGILPVATAPAATTNVVEA